MKINIMNKDVKIVYKELDGLLGVFNVDENCIYLHSKFKNNKKLKKQHDLTLKHEITHAVFAYSGLSYLLEEKLEESIVRCIEYNLLPILDQIK